MMKADTSVDSKERNPAPLHTALFLHVISFHRYLPRYQRSATAIMLEYNPIKKSETHRLETITPKLDLLSALLMKTLYTKLTRLPAKVNEAETAMNTR